MAYFCNSCVSRQRFGKKKNKFFVFPLDLHYFCGYFRKT